MSEGLPETPQIAHATKPRWPLSTIVLLALLVVAVGLLAVDWLRGRLPRNRAYERIAQEMPAEDDRQPGAVVAPPKRPISKEFEFWTPAKVHDLLNRLPDLSETKVSPNRVDSVVLETYRFSGAFKTYLLLVIYDKRAHVAVGAPQTTLKSIQRRE